MEPNRRTFLQGLAAAPLFIPSAVRGANDRPAFGIVGVGNRGQWLHQTFQKLGAQCVAVCDVYEPTLERARSESPKDVKAYWTWEKPGMDQTETVSPYQGSDLFARPDSKPAIEDHSDLEIEPIEDILKLVIEDHFAFESGNSVSPSCQV